MTIVGFVVPNAMFGKFFLDNGFGKASWKKLGSEAVGTIPSAAILADAGLTAHTFITWASWDAHQHKVRGWWLVYPATYLVGICFGAPLYLLMREYKLGDAAPVTALPSAA